jgi:hypothetical protein
MKSDRLLQFLHALAAGGQRVHQGSDSLTSFTSEEQSSGFIERFGNQTTFIFFSRDFSKMKTSKHRNMHGFRSAKRFHERIFVPPNADILSIAQIPDIVESTDVLHEYAQHNSDPRQENCFNHDTKVSAVFNLSRHVKDRL